MKRYLWIALLGVATLTGCGGYGYGYNGYYAPGPPPQARVEHYGPAPSPYHEWVSGYWGYSGNRYQWNSGRWEKRPRRNARWEQGRWEHRGNGYRYREGHWR